MTTERLFLNSLSFRYPTEPITCYFSLENSEYHRCVRISSPVLLPKEVSEEASFQLTASSGTIYTSYDYPNEGFKGIPIDFNDPDNENFVKRYYARKLKHILSKHSDLMFTPSGITSDLQIWVHRNEKSSINYLGKGAEIYILDRFTLKVRYDSFHHRPYLLLSYDRPAQVLGVPLNKLQGTNDTPFMTSVKGSIELADVNKVLLNERREDGRTSKRIERIEYLHEHNISYDSNKAFPVLTGKMKTLLGLNRQDKVPGNNKYLTYFESIKWLKDTYLQDDELRHVFNDLSAEFTPVEQHQLGWVEANKRNLIFGNQAVCLRPQDGINHGPAENCKYREVKLIFIFHEAIIDHARDLLKYFTQGNYDCELNDELHKKPLSKYVGTNVNFASKKLHIIFKDAQNPLPEIERALQGEEYLHLDSRVKYIGVYISPINKHTNNNQEREFYYRIKELFLKKDIPTQCIDSRSMLQAIENDKRRQKRNFIYTLQNMSVAMCAKLGGAPWLLNETAKKELIIGIGAFRTDGRQYIGTAFTFDNTGIFNEYCYFRESEFSQLLGAIRMAILDYSSVNDKPERLIIHYYKKLSMRHEANAMLRMLSELNLDIPLYVISINKTESEDIVLFDENSTYVDWQETYRSLMPLSGRWVNLGKANDGYRFLLCNNTRVEGQRFRATDGFPFPVKLTIYCPNREGEIPTNVVNQLIEQVYQFSRIYWKSVRQQGLPVTIKYPEMIAEIMSHFRDKTIYPDNHCLWFL